MLYSGDGAAARRLAEQTDFAEGPRRDSVLAYLAVFADDVDAAERMLTRAWDRRALVDDARLSATIAQRRAFLATARLRGHEAIDWAQRAVALAPDDAATGLLVAPSLALAFSFTGPRDEAHAALDRWLDDPAAPRHGAGFVLLALKGFLLLGDGDLPAARAAFETSAAESLDRGLLVVAALSLSGLTRAEYLAGDWDSAVVASERAIALAVESEDRWVLALAHWSASYVPAARGDWAVAEAHVRAIHEQAPQFERHVAAEALATAGLAAAQDRSEDVLAALAPLDAIEPREGVDDPAFLPWHHLKAHALVDVGELDAAERAHPVSDALAAARRNPLLAGSWLMHAASCDFARHDAERADGRAARGAGNHRADRHAVRARADRALPGSGVPPSAANGVQPRRRSSPHNSGSPSSAPSRRSTAARPSSLRAAWPRRPRKTRDYTALTPQELAVARLVVSGMTNREVAEELMLSTKTVEFHLSHVYTKLGVRTRSDLRARARANELSL